MRKIYSSIIMFLILGIVTCAADSKKGELKNKINVSKHFFVTLDNNFSITKEGEYLFLYNRELMLNIKFYEIEFTKEKPKDQIIVEVIMDLPEKPIIHEYRNGLEYYGYYEYVVARDDEYHCFYGKVISNKALLGIVFYFRDITLLEKIKKIWMSCRDE